MNSDTCSNVQLLYRGGVRTPPLSSCVKRQWRCAMQVSFILLLILHLGVVSSTGTPHAFVHPLNPRKEPSDRRVLNNRRSTSQLPLSRASRSRCAGQQRSAGRRLCWSLAFGGGPTTIRAASSGAIRPRRSATPPSPSGGSTPASGMSLRCAALPLNRAVGLSLPGASVSCALG